MIHQLIFAHPRPGMGEPEFQAYWKDVHAVTYAAKIPQIRKYMLDLRIPLSPEPADPLWSGVAEIWMDDEVAQLASMQTPEFLDGARRDEPRWAAFWRTVVLDTDTHVLMEGPPESRDSSMVKVLALVKRKAGMPLDEFRRYSLDVHGPLDMKLPGLRRYHQCHVRDSAYAIGESVLDSVSLLWFDDLAALRTALASGENHDCAEDLTAFIEPRYAHVLVTDETWIIGPEPR